MHRYGVRDVEKLLQLSRTTIQALVRARFVTPTRGPRNAWLFSFQDLVVLRMARALTEACVPRRRIVASLSALRRGLPASMPLSGLSIGAVGDRVVVVQGARRWQADTGQYLLGFEGDPETGSLRVVERASAERRAEAWFKKGVAAERANANAAIRAYEAAIAADPEFADPWVNLGALLHERCRYAEAERIYRRAIAEHGSSGLLHYNLAVLLEDMSRPADAYVAYNRALECDSEMADCHYNLALLCETIGKPKEALRHMSKYRRLTSKQE